MYPFNNYNYYQPNASLRRGRPVNSVEEAKAINIDFDGNVFYFPDLAHKCIYTKQINPDGTALLLYYELKPVSSEETPQYVTREEFDKLAQAIKKGEKYDF